MSRPIHVYTIPVPGEPIPGWIPPEPPEDYDEEVSGPWEPQHPTFSGPDPWDGQTPLFRTIGVVGLTGDEEDAVIGQLRSDGELSLTRALAQRSLVEIDGRKVKRVEMEHQMLWKQCTPIVRDLWLYAYRAHNTVREVTVGMFLATAQRIERQGPGR